EDISNDGVNDHPQCNEQRILAIEDRNRKKRGEPAPRSFLDHEKHESGKNGDTQIVPNINPREREAEGEKDMERGEGKRRSHHLFCERSAKTPRDESRERQRAD